MTKPHREGVKEPRSPSTCPVGWPPPRMLRADIHAFDASLLVKKQETHVLRFWQVPGFSRQSSFCQVQFVWLLFRAAVTGPVDGGAVFWNMSEI